MAKRKQRTIQTAALSIGKLVEDAVICLLLLIPLAAALEIANCFVILMTPDLLPLWAAISVGLLIGGLMVRLVSGADFKEFVPPGVLLFLAYAFLPLCARTKQIRLRHKHHAPHAQVRQATKTP